MGRQRRRCQGRSLIKDGTARMVSIQPPAYSTAERVIDLVPEVLEKIELYVDKYGKKAESSAQDIPPVSEAE